LSFNTLADLATELPQRAGADFKALVVFHVTNPNPVVPGTPCNIKGKVLALHGSADPVTPKPMMDASRRSSPRPMSNGK
jgi:pimeloyl-ACP methyl ester carboxylesterase